LGKYGKGSEGGKILGRRLASRSFRLVIAGARWKPAGKREQRQGESQWKMTRFRLHKVWSDSGRETTKLNLAQEEEDEKHLFDPGPGWGSNHPAMKIKKKKKDGDSQRGMGEEGRR